MNRSSKDTSELSPKTRALVEALLRVATTSPSQEITRRKAADPVPLSFAQQRLWFLDQLEPGNPAYNVLRTFRFTGRLDAAVLEECLNEIVRRHESLRTTFSVVKEQPVQVITPSLTLLLPIIDFSDWPEPERDAQVQQFVTKESQRAFDLAQGPLLRTTLLRLGEEEHILLLVIHHIVSDGWSMVVFFRELATLYEAFSMEQPSPLPQLPIQYADFAVWQREWLQGEVLEAQLTYWKQQLSGHPPVLNLPTDRPRPAVQTFRGARQSIVLSRELTEALKVLSHQEGATLFMTLLAAFKTLLYRYTRQEDMLVGSPIANRNRLEVEGLIGYFSNIVIMRTDLSGDPSFRELVSRVRRVALGAYQHQDLPFQKLADFPNLARTPLSRAVFALRGAPRQPLELPGITVSSLDVHNGMANFDLYLSMEEKTENLTGVLQYKTDLFNATTITQMLRYFQTLLETLVANPDQRLLDLPHLTEAEQRQLTVNRDDAQADYPNIAPTSGDAPWKTLKSQRTFVAPQDTLQFQLTKVWEQVLGIQPIGVKDNFFELGGHSLLALRLIAEIEKAFNKHLPPAILFQTPTVEQLANILRQAGWSAPWSSLVAIQPSGSKPPFFCVPGNLGNVFTDLGDLAWHLGPDQPFYGLQDGIQNPTQIEALATQYLDEIRAAQPEGPYLLGGVCSGGVIAFEMAQQLQTQGQQVALLALVEPPPPRVPGLRSYIELATSIFRRFVRRFGHHSRNVSQLGPAEQRAFVRLKAKVIANLWAARCYAPQPYLGQIHLFFASESPRSPNDPRLGWRELATGGAETHMISGNHNTITGANDTKIEKAHMQVLAEQLSVCIAEALTDDDGT